MNRRIFDFELNGKTVLAFDTGLDARAFAQAKMARLITCPGYIIYPDGKIETWRPEGTAEHGSGSPQAMIIWGPLFPGEPLPEIINDQNRKDEALNAVRFWLGARIFLEASRDGTDKRPDAAEPPLPGPDGALIVTKDRPGYPAGTVFFPPARLLKRTLEAGGKTLDAGRWVHPDLDGNEGISFSSGAMLYRIFCGVPPFPKDTVDELRQDIREGVFIPPDLAAPGLAPEMAALITKAMESVPKNREEKRRPPPEAIRDFIGPAYSGTASSWVRTLGGEEAEKIRLEKEQYGKKKERRVKTRRFMIRNAAIISGAIIACIILALVIRGGIKHRAELPTVKGMNPAEVAAAYYSAFNDLDHTMMDACVSGKAGRGDIDMAINLFVISRVRQAYETPQDSFMPAAEWIDKGRPAGEKNIFGITNLEIRLLSERNGNANLEAGYILWLPGAYFGGEEGSSAPPGGLLIRDRLALTFIKNSWRITDIERTSRVLKP